MGSVGGPDFPEFGAGPGHDVGNPERPADFHQFTAGNHDFLAQSQGIQDQHHRCGVIVDDGRRLGPGQAADPAFQMAVAITAPAAGQIEFQVAGADSHALDCLQCDGRN